MLEDFEQSMLRRECTHLYNLLQLIPCKYEAAQQSETQAQIRTQQLSEAKGELNT